MDKLIGKDINLTPKQKKFAENIVLNNMNKTESYRDAYPNSKGKASTQSVEANKLFNNPKVSLMISQLEHAKSLNNLIFSPSNLRSLAISTISEIAMDEDITPRDRLQALRLIGQFSEVSLFDERKETTIVTNSEEVKLKLMESLRKAIASSSSLSEAKKKNAEELLNEIHGGDIQDAELVEEDDTQSDSNAIAMQDTTQSQSDATPIEQLAAANPTHPTHQKFETGEVTDGGIIPHNQSAISDKVTPILDEVEEEGEGVNEILKVELGVDIEMTPLDDSEQN